MTTGELADLFLVTSQTVINWLEEGRIPFERIGRGPRRIPELEVLRYIEQSGLSPDTLHTASYATLIKSVGTQPGERNYPAVAVLDHDAKIISWNEGASLLFGFLPREMLGRPIDRLMTQVEGKSGGMEYQLRSSWPGNVLFLRTKERDRSGNDLRCQVTISRFFSGAEAKKAGYILLFSQEE